MKAVNAKRIAKKIGMFIFEAVLILAIIVVASQIVRTFNLQRFPIMQVQTVEDKGSYETSQRIKPIEGEYLNGFHFTPETKLHEGVVVAFGGSEGSPAYERAAELADEGYEVLALYFFGQPNQKPTLSEVPLEQFEEVSTYIGSGPVTVIGASKGAEFAELLAAHGFAVDNVVAFAPAHYSYSGLDFSKGMRAPSFTLGGEPVPFASLQNASPLTGWKLMWDMMSGYPPSYRKSYEQAAAKAPGEASIELFLFDGHLLLFAGEDDRMWQSDVAALELESSGSAAGSVEAHVYPDAGHVFFPDASQVPNGWQIMFGGTVEGNRAAYEDSERVLRERLAEWHPATQTGP